jgi:hypothetical protein
MRWKPALNAFVITFEVVSFRPTATVGRAEHRPNVEPASSPSTKPNSPKGRRSLVVIPE